MNQETQQIINKVETVTGYRVSVGSVSGISSYAQMITATPQNPMHIINVNQKYSQIGDYVVALQCAMILSKWSDPKRIPVFSVNGDKVSYQIDKSLKNRKLAKLPGDVARQFASTLVEGLVHQLLSLPTEMIAIDICKKECPSLENMMEIAIKNEIQELHQSLEPRIKQITPDEIFEKNAAMNAAFTLNWSRISGVQTILVPFKAADVLTEGKGLLEIYDNIDTDDTQKYIKSVDGWAHKLKMASLYTWEFRNEENVS